MTLYERIDSDAKKSLKDGNAVRLLVLRMIISAAKLVLIEKNIKTIDDDIVIQILQKQVKQHRESIEQFEKGGRLDLVAKEKAELAVLEEYMPKQLSSDELMAIVKIVITETGSSTKADTGKVMKAVMEKAKGKADGKAISLLVQQFLK